MRIWLATVGEPLPIDEGGQRLLRTGQFAAWLAARGHEVVFFTGTMDHHQRQLRADETTVHEVSPNYRIVALAGRLYTRTISFARFRNHADVARSFRAFAPSLPLPDVVLASYPTEEFCRAILDLCQPHDVPVAIDVRDFWPDIFSEMLPGPLKPLGPLVFRPFERSAGRTLARADALSGMTESAMKWAVRKAGRGRRDEDFWFPFSYRRRTAPLSSPAPHDGLRVCFLGTLSHRSNLEMLVDAFRILSETGGHDARLTICGSGEAEFDLRKRAAGAVNIEFRGWLAADQLDAVMRASDLGALPYDRPDFHMSIPNKCVEYLAGGLPVVSCTEGEVRTLLASRDCGIWTPADARETASALADLAGRPGRLREMKANAMQVFDDTFEENIVFERALRHLEALLPGSHAKIAG